MAQEMAYTLTEDDGQGGEILVGHVTLFQPKTGGAWGARLHDKADALNPRFYLWQGDLSTVELRDAFKAALQDLPHANWIEE